MRRGVLLLHGSSGTPDLERARILAAEGYDVDADGELGTLAWGDVRLVFTG